MANSDHSGETEQELLEAIRGAQVVLVQGKTLSLLGMTFDQAGLIQAIGGHLGPYTNVRDDRAKLVEDLSDRRAKEPVAKAFIRALKQAVAASYGESSVEFSQFGFKPNKKPIELTPEQKKLKVDRMRATRLARKTLGSRQKEHVKGVVNPEQSSAPGNGAAGSASPAKP